jgi:uncharacterized protein YegL
MMIYRHIPLTTLLVGLLVTGSVLAAPNLANVRARQLPDGTGRVEIMYDLTGAPITGTRIRVRVSDNGGRNYAIIPDSRDLAGEVGPAITDGINKRVIWDCLQTLPADTFRTTFRVSVEATHIGGTYSIALVFDKSGSMSGRKITEAKQAARDFVNIMFPGDRASIIAFDDRVAVLQDMTEDKTALLNAIDEIGSGGMTAIYDGIFTGIQTCIPAPGQGVVFAFTDGNDNSSSRSPQECINLAVAESVVVYTVDLENTANASLENIANSTGGLYVYANSAADLTAIWAQFYAITRAMSW